MFIPDETSEFDGIYESYSERVLNLAYRITGNEDTRTGTLRKAVRIRDGDPIRSRQLVGARKRLLSLRLFESLSVSVPGLNLEPEEEEIKSGEVMRPVLVKVKEQKSLEMEIGARYDSDTGFEGFLSLQENNLFHRAQQIRVSGLAGETKWEAAVVYTVPTLLGYRVTGTVSGQHKREDYEAFTKEISSASGTLHQTFWDIFTPAFSVSIKQESVFDVKSPSPDAPLPETTTNIFFEPLFRLDTRDDKIYPGKGFFLQAGVAVSGRPWGSTDDLIVTGVRLSGYHSFFPKWTLAATVSTDFVEPYGETTRVPSTQLLFAGGNNSVRGFPWQKLGPLDVLGNPLGGTTRVLGSVEFRFPLYRMLHGYVFVDVGSLTNGWEQVTWDTFRWTSGGGVRLYTPVGPLCLGYGYQLQENPPLDRGQVIFSLGFPY